MDNGFDNWGGYMEAKITKLEEQFTKSSDPFRQTNLFSGISIFVNGLTDPSADELKRIMMVHGGTYHHYQRSYTTFVIASNLPDVKIRNMNTSKVISPQWIVDCLKEKRIIDYTKYLLYTNHKSSQPKINFAVIKEQKPIEIDEISNGTNEDVEIIQENVKMQDNDDDDDDDERIDPSQETLKLNRFQINPLKSVSPSTSKLHPQKSTASVSKTAVDPDFLSEFYSNSRLHHIATLGANFKQYISDLRENHNGDFPKRLILKEQLQKSESPTPAERTTVMHIDMDCFFVSVGLRSHPELRGQPVAVTHSKGARGQPQMRPGVDRQLEKDLYMRRLNEKFHDNVMSTGKADKVRNGFDGNDSLSEIASCSYEARQMGVKNGMFVGQALKLCPQLKTIPYDFEGYKEVAYTLYDTIAQYTLNIEAVSCDEMFVDLTDLLNDVQVDAMKLVEYIRNEVKLKTNCPCSAGVGSNRLQARMATKKAKPDGQFYIHPENVEDYMKNIPISDLPGVGYSTTHSLEELDCKTCGDLQKISLSKLQNELGKKFGETLYQYCRGIDNRPLTYGQIRKSVSAEVNYGIRFTEFAELEKFLRQLCTEVHSRLTKIKRKGKCITLKLMIRSKDAPIETAKFMGHGFCDYLTKSVTLSDFTDNLDVITKNVLTTIKSLNIPPKELRGIGIQITKLNTPPNASTNENVVGKIENSIKDLFSKAMKKQKLNNSNSSCTNKSIEVSSSTSTSLDHKESISKNVDLPVAQIKSPNKINTKSSTNKSTEVSSSTSTSLDHKESITKIVNLPVAQIKSPKKINTKSPPKGGGVGGKRRGRNPIKPKDKKIPNIANMLQNSAGSNALKKPSSSLLHSDLDTIRETDMDGIDPKVLAELPEDIRQEVIRDYIKVRKIEQKRTSPKTEPVQQQHQNSMAMASSSSTSKATKIVVDVEFLNALPISLRKEIEKEISQLEDKIIIRKNDESKGIMNGNEIETKVQNTNTSNGISDDNIFVQKNCEDLITAWVESADLPEDYDVEILTKHACELISIKNIYDLYDPLVSLKSVIERRNSCNWHKIYTRIIDEIQLKMKSVYGSKLLLDDRIDCDKCSINIS